MSGVLRVEDMVMTWLVNFLARRSIYVRCQDEKYVGVIAKWNANGLSMFISRFLISRFQSNHVPHTFCGAGRDDLICRTMVCLSLNNGTRHMDLLRQNTSLRITI